MTPDELIKYLKDHALNDDEIETLCRKVIEYVEEV